MNILNFNISKNTLIVLGVFLFILILFLLPSPQVEIVKFDESGVLVDQEIALIKGTIWPSSSKLLIGNEIISIGEGGSFEYEAHLDFGENSFDIIASFMLPGNNFFQKVKIVRGPNKEETADFSIDSPTEKQVITEPEVEIFGTVYNENTQIVLKGSTSREDQSVLIENRKFRIIRQLTDVDVLASLYKKTEKEETIEIESINSESGLSETKTITILRKLSEEELTQYQAKLEQVRTDEKNTALKIQRLLPSSYEVSVFDVNGNFAKSGSPEPLEVIVNIGPGKVSSCTSAKEKLKSVLSSVYSSYSLKGRISRVKVTAFGYLNASLGSNDVYGSGGQGPDWSNGPTLIWNVLQQINSSNGEYGALENRTYGQALGGC